MSITINVCQFLTFCSTQIYGNCMVSLHLASTKNYSSRSQTGINCCTITTNLCQRIKSCRTANRRNNKGTQQPE